MLNIKVRTAVESDALSILKFLRESYYPEEPLTRALEPFQQADEDEQFNLSCIKYGTCVVAYSDDNNSVASSTISNSNQLDQEKEMLPCNDKTIKNKDTLHEFVGALIAGPKYPGEADHLIDASETVKSVKWSKMLKLLSSLEAKSNVFEYFNCDSAVHCHAMAVDPKARGKSIGLLMLNKFIEICKNLKYPVITLDCTSMYSIRLCEKLNMECLNEIKFTDYRDEWGEQVFRPPSPHNLIKTFAKKIDHSA